MYPSIFARTYSGTSAQAVLDSAAADGFQAVQFNLQCAGLPTIPESVPVGLPEQVALYASSLNLTIDALSGTYNMAHPDKLVREKYRRGFVNVLEAAKFMGVQIVTLCTGSRDQSNMWKHHPDNVSVEAWKDLCSEMEYALGQAEDLGIQLGIEPEAGNVVCNAKMARRLLTEMSSPNLGVVLDAANLVSAELLPKQREVMEEAFAMVSDRILLAHVKDIDRQGNVVATGRGDVDLHEFVRLLHFAKYNGALVAHGFAQEQAKCSAKVVSELCEVAP